MGTGSASGTGSGNGNGMGDQKMQGVMLATDILGATVKVNPQGNDQGAGGTGGMGVTSTDTPSAGGTSSTPSADTTATATTGGSGTGTGTGSGSGDFSTGTVEDMIIRPDTGDVQYLVISFGGQTHLIPVPIGFLRWDATTNGLTLMVNQNALQNAPVFSSDQFPDTSSSGWDSQFSTYWQSNGGNGSGSGSGASATATP
jgi:hypothetical protein